MNNLLTVELSALEMSQLVNALSDEESQTLAEREPEAYDDEASNPQGWRPR